MTIIGYKFATSYNHSKDVILTLEIPADAVTNMSRPSVAVKETAAYRANKVKVLSIEDNDGVHHTVAYSGLGTKKEAFYAVGMITEDPMYNKDNTLVDAAGLHFFLTRRAAENYILRPIQGGNGVYQAWHDNGRVRVEFTVVEGKVHGLYQTWFPDGQLSCSKHYMNGVEHGPYRIWLVNGQVSSEGTFVDGRPVQPMNQCSHSSLLASRCQSLRD